MICKKHGKLKPGEWTDRGDQGGKRCHACSREYTARYKEKKLAERAQDALIPSMDSRVAYLLYQRGGLDPDEVVLKGKPPLWKKWGYADPETATLKLVYMWRNLGLPKRGGGSFNRRTPDGPKICNICKGPQEERTARCGGCTDRHTRWRRLGRPYVEAHNAKTPA